MQKKYCNICGKELDEWDQLEDYSIDRVIGYGSKHDGGALSIHICIDCMDKLIDSCKMSPLCDADDITSDECIFREVK